MTLSHVAVSPGNGVLVRRESAVLFDPTGENVALVTSFDRARDDVAAVRSVKQGVIERGFEALPFVMLSWDYRLELLAFGDYELFSSAPSAPMINGARSTGWVEHGIAPQDFARHEATSIWCGAEADPVTNLRLGIASCGGIKVTLTPEQAIAFASEPASASPSVQRHGVSDLAPPPSATGTFAADILSTTDSALCERGHANPANSSACFTCGAMMRANGSMHSDGRTLSEIVFPQGTVVAIDRTVRLGRAPTDPGDGTLPVTIHHDKVDADHAQISVDGWAVLITDLGSGSGTFVTPPGAVSPTKLRAHQPHVLETGTTVQLGAAAASFAYTATTIESTN